MINTDTFYLLILAGAGAYAIKNLEKRPRYHLVEGFTDDDQATQQTKNTKTALDGLMGKITKYYKNYNDDGTDQAYEIDETTKEIKDYNIGGTEETSNTL